MKGWAAALPWMWACAAALAVGEGLPAPSSGAAPVTRRSITFILGVDADPARPLYAMADRYYRLDPEERTDEVVNGLRSLKEVRDHLAAHRPANGLPWGVVNLVVHGNAAGYLESPVLPGAAMASPEGLEAAATCGALSPLPDALLDEGSELRALGCALGRNPRMLTVLAKAFGGDDIHRPRVCSSLHFTGFMADGGSPSGCRRCLWDAWTLPLGVGARPSPETLIARLRALDPHAEVDWQSALSRANPADPSDAYAYEHPSEFRYTQVYASEAEVPAFQNKGRSWRWLMENKGFHDALGRSGLYWDRFQWELTPARYQAADGSSHPALTAHGTGLSLTILRPLVEPDPAEPAGRRPLRAAWDDERYFAVVR